MVTLHDTLLDETHDDSSWEARQNSRNKGHSLESPAPQ
jgi:hypothetical protein